MTERDYFPQPRPEKYRPMLGPISARSNETMAQAVLRKYQDLPVLSGETQETGEQES